MIKQFKKKFHIAVTMILICFGLFFILPINTAYAYLDPGTGSFIIQIIIAGFVSTMFAIKIYWRKIKDFFGNLIVNDPSSKDDEDENA